MALLFFILVPFVSNAAENSVLINLDYSNATLGEVLNEVGRQSYLSVVYDSNDFDSNQLITVKSESETIEEVMKKIIVDTDVSYAILDDHLMLFNNEKLSESYSVSQTKRYVKGTVTDELNEPLIGVSVLLQGTTTGAITDLDGNFSIEVSGNNPVLEISYIGYQKMTVPVGSKTVVNIVMKEDAQVLSEVVVTAMGIEREAKSLTYATQTVKSDELTRIKEPNFINALQGKSAGMVITPNNSGAGGGATKITLRGQTSILGSNQPLIVLDGVPLQDGMSGQTTEIMQGASRDGGDLLSTLNPDDIESMTILKGPNAAALYGSSANNGVIIITTKSGEKGTLRVDVSSSTSVETMFMYPKTQQLYGLTPNATLEAWGPKISDMTADDVASQPYFTASPRDPVKDFFKNGITLNNGITLTGGNEMARTYFSYGNTSQWGMVPNNKFMRHNFNFRESFSLFDKRLDVTVGLNYIHQELHNRPVAGRVLSALHGLYRMPSNVDMRYFKNHYKHVGTTDDFMVYHPVKGNKKLVGQEIQSWDWYDQNLNNPYWIVNMMNQKQIKDRILGSLNFRFKLWRDIYYQSRVNIDLNIDNGLVTEYATVMRQDQSQGGQYWSGSGRSTDIFNDHMISANERFADKYDINAATGFSFSRTYNRNTSITTYIDTSGTPNAFLPQNSAQSRPGNPNGSATSATDSYDNTNWYAAYFATLSLGFFDKFYVDGSYRMEWAKSFQQFMQKRNSYTYFDYYSAGANLLLDKILPWKMPVFNQIKLRGSWSVVGTPIPPGMYGRQEMNLSTGVISSRPPIFKDPKPERTTAYEAGLEVWMLDNTLDFDITYYNATLKNQFLWVATSSGESKPVNTGKIRNYGLEFTANYRWMINRNLTWQTGFNMAWNDNRILETYKTESGAPFEVQVGPSNFKIKYIEGGRYGDIYVNSFYRDDNGAIVVNNAGNYAEAIPQMASGEYLTYVGNTSAKINFGWNNTFKYKGFNLYLLIDGKIGGKVMSLTEADRDRNGLSERSAYDRLNGERVIQNGIEYVLKELPDGQKVSVENYYKTVGANPMEDYVYDATNVRLRDLSLGYSFPGLFKSNKFGLTASFTVKNVCFLYKKSPIDPDISMSAANGFSGIEAYSLPTVRSYGLNLKFNF